MEFPVYELENDKFQVKANLAIYAKEAVAAACYKYSGKYFVHQELVEEQILITLESKENNVVDVTIAKSFCNELIDQQIRFNVNSQFGSIRDMIVTEAFRPVNK